VQKKQMPFLAVAPRLGRSRRQGRRLRSLERSESSCTEEAHSLGAGFCEEGQTEGRMMILDSGSFAADA